MDDTLYSKSHNPPIVLTVEVLQDILQKVPKGTKVALYNTRECDGLYSANPRTCRQMDEGAGWGEK
jgi:hypothetical protein